MMTSTSTNKTSMKQLSIVVALAIAVLSTGVSAQPAALENMFVNGNANGNANGVNNNLDDDDAPVQVLFQYTKNNAQNAKNEAKKLGQLGIDIPGLGVASVATNNRSYKAMQKNPNFANVEVDDFYYAIGDDTPMLRGAEQGERQLAESVPYGITMVQADQVDLADVPAGSDPIKICVVDTGYTPGHPDLPSSNTAGYSPYNGQTWDNDGDSHGTHVAGTIGAIRGNGIGVDSVLGDPTKFDFYIGKGLSDSGSGSYSNIIASCNKCVENGARIINMSLGGGYSSTMEDVMSTIYNAGVLIVAAAGNGGNGSFSYPASHSTVMSVAAVDSNENRRTFSQYNTQVEIAGPGSGTLSTTPPSGYSSYSGTSMASPHVAGVAALVWSHYPECTNVQIRNVLLKSAKDKGAAGCDIFYGFGIVQAKDALDLLDTYGCEAGGTDTPTSGGAEGGCAQTDLSLPPPQTPVPETPAPGPVTPSPVTPSPVTPSPVAPAPVTPSPVTPAPAPLPTPGPTDSPPTSCAAKFDSCVFNSDCCSNKCRGNGSKRSCK